MLRDPSPGTPAPHRVTELHALCRLLPHSVIDTGRFQPLAPSCPSERTADHAAQRGPCKPPAGALHGICATASGPASSHFAGNPRRILVFSNHRDESRRPSEQRRAGVYVRAKEDPMLRTSDDLQINGQRLRARADLNVPMQDGKVTDDRLIRTIARTVALGGPLGAAEITGLERATQAVIRHVARRTRDGGPTNVAEISGIFREKARSAHHGGGWEQQ